MLSPARGGSRFPTQTLVLGVAAVLILQRALVYLLFERVGFDADQAIVGLMAKHLSQGRAFPLFLYGQTYMLAIEAWAAVPFFLLVGPTVSALRLSMLAWNVAFGLLLVAGLRRDAGLGPWTALVPALFFLAAPASVSGQLIAAQAGTIEPFVYIVALWFLRRRPLWFGMVLAIGFRNREFTAYAVPALWALDVATGALNRERVREWLISLAIFCAVWETIEALKPFSDFSGPGTRGQLLGGFSGSQVGNLLDRFNWQPGALVERVTRIGPELLSWFAGGSQVDIILPLGDRPWLLWVAGLFMLIAAGRLIGLMIPSTGRPKGLHYFGSTGRPEGLHYFGSTGRPEGLHYFGSTGRPEGLHYFRSTDRPEGLHYFRFWRDQIAHTPFAWYLVGIGTMAIAVFLAGKPILSGYSRYVMLGLLTPVGLTAALLALEPRRVVRGLVLTAVTAWAAVAVFDHARVLARVMRQPPSYAARELADRLVERHVPVAAAGYWQAYEITFLARERVRVASNDFVRIQEYQTLFIERQREALLIQEKPCPGGEQVANWYLCSP